VSPLTPDHWAIDREHRTRETPILKRSHRPSSGQAIVPSSRMLTQHNRDSSTYTSDIKRIRRHSSDLVRPASPTITQRIMVLTPMRTFERKYEVSTVVIVGRVHLEDLLDLKRLGLMTRCQRQGILLEPIPRQKSWKTGNNLESKFHQAIEFWHQRGRASVVPDYLC
jgi:hypothetical protein